MTDTTDEVARQMISQHMNQCDERHGHMNRSFERIAEAMEKNAEYTREGLSRVHARIDQTWKLSVRWIFGLALLLISALMSALGTLVFTGLPWQ